MAHHIIDTAPTAASLGQNGLNHVRAAQADLARYKQLCLATLDGTYDYTQLEGAAAGLGIAAGEGEAVFGAFAAVCDYMVALSENFIGPVDQGA